MYICAREGLVGEHGVKSAADSNSKGGYYGKGLLEAGTITYPTHKRGSEGQSPLTMSTGNMGSEPLDKGVRALGQSEYLGVRSLAQQRGHTCKIGDGMWVRPWS